MITIRCIGPRRAWLGPLPAVPLSAQCPFGVITLTRRPVRMRTRAGGF